MRLVSRIVVTIDDLKGKTGTIMDFVGGVKNILVGFDDGTNGKFEKVDLIEINDVEFNGFHEGMNIYVSDFNKVGKIVSSELKNGAANYNLRWADGTTSVVALDAEKDFVAI